MYTGTRIVEVDNRQDVIDSRDIIARIEELAEERELLQDAIDEAKEELGDIQDPLNVEGTAEALSTAQTAVEEAQQALDDWDGDTDGEELKVLKALAEECEGYGDWADGETLIRDSYFEGYAQELAEDCCEMPRELHWPFTCIDWEAAADELKMDYTCVEYDGVDYWMRA
jgi:hypothetical protein